VVYDKVTGNIVHIHHTIIVPGAIAPSDKEIEASAMRLATKTTGRNAAELAMISIDRNDLRRGHHYSVDVTKKELRSLKA
jgi:hypothetical protein